MRICNSFAPGAMVATCLLLLIKYPLTRERMEEIHDILVVRRKADWDTHHSKKGHQPS